MKSTCTKSCRRKVLIFVCLLAAFQIYHSLTTNLGEDLEDVSLPAQNVSKVADVFYKGDSNADWAREKDVFKQAVKKYLFFQKQFKDSFHKAPIDINNDFFEKHPAEAAEMEKMFDERKKQLNQACGKHANAATEQRANFLKFLPTYFDSNILKRMVRASFSDDSNRLLLCSFPGIYRKDFSRILDHFVYKMQKKEENDAAILQAKLEKEQRELEEEFETDDESSILSKTTELVGPTTTQRPIPTPVEPVLTDEAIRNVNSRPLITYSRADIYTRVKAFRKVVLVTEPLQRLFTQWRETIDGDYELKRISSYDVSSNFTRFFYLISLRVKDFLPQAEMCSLCQVDYDYVIKMENFKKEFDYVSWKLNVGQSGLFRPRNFIVQPIKELVLPAPGPEALLHSGELKRAQEETTSPKTNETEKFPSYERFFGKLPSSVMQELIRHFRTDFFTLGYVEPQIKLLAKVMDEEEFGDWQRKIILARISQEKLRSKG